MQNTLSAPLTLPSGAYALASNPKTAYFRGSSMNQGVYVVKPEDLTALPGVASIQITQTLARRAAGARGSNRAHLLVQAIALDVNGRQQITSFNPTLTAPNFFVPPVGVAYDQAAVNQAVFAIGMATLLNSQGSTTAGSQADWLNSVTAGLMP